MAIQNTLKFVASEKPLCPTDPPPCLPGNLRSIHIVKHKCNCDQSTAKLLPAMATAIAMASYSQDIRSHFRRCSCQHPLYLFIPLAPTAVGKLSDPPGSPFPPALSLNRLANGSLTLSDGNFNAPMRNL